LFNVRPENASGLSAVASAKAEGRVPPHADDTPPLPFQIIFDATFISEIHGHHPDWLSSRPAAAPIFPFSEGKLRP
jgi:hypothetical protein